MQKVKNNLKEIMIKFLFFLVSSIFCFLLTEITLDYFLRPYSVEKKYKRTEAVNEGNTNYIQKNRHDDIYENFNSSNNQIQIITIGDSYTNGGNVKWHDTYPFNLFLNLDRQYTISNQGLCEDTTSGVYFRIKKYLDSNPDGEKIFIVLVGAADMFIESNIDMKDFYSDYIKSGSFRQQTLEFKGSTDLNYFKKLKTYKMFKYVLLGLKSTISNFYFKHFDKAPLVTLNAECFNKVDNSRNLCLQTDFKKIFQNLTQIFNKEIFKNIIQQIIQLNSPQENAETHIVEDLLQLGSIFPKVLIVPDYIFNIITYTSRQSKYSLETDIIPFLRKNYDSEKQFFEAQKKKQKHNFTTKSLLEAASAWNTKIIENKKIQTQHFENIIKLIKTRGSKLVLMTYPLNYHSLNQAIRQISQKNNIHLVDLEKKFAEAYRSGTAKDALIRDWEHCTPQGYQLIADLVTNEIKRLLPISK